MKSFRSVVVLAGAVALVAAACGEDGDTSSANSSTEADRGGVRTVELEMMDVEFASTTLDVARGETVRLVLTNTGALPHDAFVGDAEAQADHETEMREADENDEMGAMGPDDDGNGITVEPGDTGELTYTFDQTGTVEIGCHQPGHYDAGMKVDVSVS